MLKIAKQPTKHVMDRYIIKAISSPAYGRQDRNYFKKHLDFEEAYQIILDAKHNNNTDRQINEALKKGLNEGTLLYNYSNPKIDQAIQHYFVNKYRGQLTDTSIPKIWDNIKRLDQQRKSENEIRSAIHKGVERGEYNAGWVARALDATHTGASYFRHPIASIKRPIQNKIGIKRYSGDARTVEVLEQNASELGEPAVKVTKNIKKGYAVLNILDEIKKSEAISKGKFYHTENIARKGISNNYNALIQIMDNQLKGIARDAKHQRKLEERVEEEPHQHRMAAAILLFIGISTFIIALISPSLTGYTIVANGVYAPTGVFAGAAIALLGWLYYKTKR